MNCALFLCFGAPERSDAQTSVGDVECVQSALEILGFSPGPVDGQIGNRTRSAYKDYYRSYFGSDPDHELIREFALNACITLSSNRMTAHRIEVEEGLHLEAYLHRPLGNGRVVPAVIILHGWGGSANDINYSARIFAASGFAALAVSMRGWGESEGVDDCGLQQSADVAELANWLGRQAGIDSSRIGLLGYSQGGQVALIAAAKLPVLEYVISLFAPTDVEQWAEETTNREIPSYVRTVCAPEYEARSPLSYSGNIKIPVMIVHGTRDSRVPVTQALQLAKSLEGANNPPELVLVPGARHLFTADQWNKVYPDIISFASSVDVAGGTRTSPVQGSETASESPSNKNEIVFFSPTCSECISAVPQRDINSSDDELRSIVMPYASNDGDIEIIANIFCNTDRSRVVLHRFVQSVGDEIHFLGASSEQEFIEAMIKRSRAAAVESGVGESELESCAEDLRFPISSVLAAMIRSRVPAGSVGLEMGGAQIRFELVSPQYGGGTGVGPSASTNVLSSLSGSTTTFSSWVDRLKGFWTRNNGNDHTEIVTQTTLEIASTYTQHAAQGTSLTGSVQPSAIGAVSGVITDGARVGVELGITDYQVSRSQQRQISLYGDLVVSGDITENEALNYIMASNYTRGAGRDNVRDALIKYIEDNS